MKAGCIQTSIPRQSGTYAKRWAFPNRQIRLLDRSLEKVGGCAAVFFASTADLQSLGKLPTWVRFWLRCLEVTCCNLGERLDAKFWRRFPSSSALLNETPGKDFKVLLQLEERPTYLDFLVDFHGRQRILRVLDLEPHPNAIRETENAYVEAIRISLSIWERMGFVLRYWEIDDFLFVLFEEALRPAYQVESTFGVRSRRERLEFLINSIGLIERLHGQGVEYNSFGIGAVGIGLDRKIRLRFPVHPRRIDRRASRVTDLPIGGLAFASRERLYGQVTSHELSEEIYSLGVFALMVMTGSMPEISIRSRGERFEGFPLVLWKTLRGLDFLDEVYHQIIGKSSEWRKSHEMGETMTAISKSRIPDFIETWLSRVPQRELRQVIRKCLCSAGEGQYQEVREMLENLVKIQEKLPN